MERGIDNFSNDRPTFSVVPSYTVVEYCPVAYSASSSRPHIHVQFSHFITGSRSGRGYTLCLGNDEEEEEDSRRDFIFSTVQPYLPIDAGTLMDIADEVIDKIRRFACSLTVRIRSVRPYNSDYDSYSDSDSDSDYSVVDDEEVTNFSDDDSVLDDGEVTYLSFDGRVLDDEDEVTYLSDDRIAYPRVTAVIYGENSGVAAARGVDQKRQAIKWLKRKIIERDCGGEDGEKSGGGYCCVICLEELTAGTEVAVMPCNHCSFHDGCLSTWLERSLSCPLCRHKVSGPPLPEPEPFLEHDQYIS